MAKRMKKSAETEVVKTERISILPDLTPELQTDLNKTVERKAHLEYLCFMMLRDLHKRLPLQRMVEREVQREGADEELLVDFFTEGNPAAECLTIQGLLDEWAKTTDRMLTIFAGRG